MTSPRFKPKVDALSSALAKRPPFCSGVTPLNNNGVLLYRKGENRDAGYINFANADEEAMEDLSSACTPAAIGHGQHRKLDSDRFLSQMDIHSSGIAQHVADELLEGKSSERQLRFELCALNLYEKDSFVKPHKDTPRPTAENIFGSLIITFPTPHTGGTLVLHHESQEWCINSSSILSQQPTPSMCFIAFYGDVELEVLPLQNGHIVTLTYTIYIDKLSHYPEPPFSPTIPIHHSTPDEHIFRSALVSFLQVPEVFPNGGVLGFELRFEYPLVPSKTKLEQILHILKGSDATIKNVAHSLSLKVIPEILVDDHYGGVNIMYPELEDWNGDSVKSWIVRLASSAYSEAKGFVVHKYGNPALDFGDRFDDYEEDVKVEVKEVIWVTPATNTESGLNGIKATYWQGEPEVYGDSDAFAGQRVVDVSGKLVLAVMVGPPGHRETLEKVPEREGLYKRNSWRRDSDSSS